MADINIRIRLLVTLSKFMFGKQERFNTQTDSHHRFDEENNSKYVIKKRSNQFLPCPEMHLLIYYLRTVNKYKI